MHKTKEKPGIGIYKCTRCGTIVKINNANDPLPSCPKCHNTVFMKVQ